MVNPQQDPWESLPGLDNQKPQTQSNKIQPIKEQKKESSWEDMKSPEMLAAEHYQEMLETNEFERGSAQSTSRALETLIGIPGSTQQFLKTFSKYIPGFTGIIGSIVGQPTQGISMETGQPVETPSLGLNLPSQQDLQKVSETLTRGYTKPKNKFEEGLSEATIDVAGTFGPGTGRIGLVKNLLIPLGANAVKLGSELFTKDEKKQDMAKIGSWMALSLLSRPGARDYGNALIGTAQQQLPPGLTANPQRYLNRLAPLQQRFLSNDPRTTVALAQMRGIENDVANGQTGIRNLFDRYNAINATKEHAGMFELAPRQRQSAIRNVNDVLGIVRDEIEDAGRRYPHALQNWRDGLGVLRTVHQSNRIADWASRQLTGKYHYLVQGGIASLLGLSGYSNPEATAVGLGIAAAGYTGLRTLYRASTNPNIARHYAETLSCALREDRTAFINNAIKLDKELNAEEKKSNGISSTKKKSKKSNE